MRSNNVDLQMRSHGNEHRFTIIVMQGSYLLTYLLTYLFLLVEGPLWLITRERRCVCNLLLKLPIVGASATLAGRLFHVSTIFIV